MFRSSFWMAAGLVMGAVASAGCERSSSSEVALAKAKAEIAKAEAETAKARAEATKAEADAAKALAEVQKLKADSEAATLKAKGALALRQRLAKEALARVTLNAQAMLDTSFPNAIGSVPFLRSEFDGLASVPDGYLATVKIYYTNILSDNYFMEILVNYDDLGGFRSWRVGQCNDRFPPNTRDKLFDRFIK